jgi:quinol monooxygenase YgiN
MSQPFAYVGTWTIKPGKLEEAKKVMSEHAAIVEASEPRLIAFHVYFDDAGNTASVVQVHPDSASMETHMQVIAEHLGPAFEVIDTILSEQYFGSMSESLSQTLAQWETPEVKVTKMPAYVAGFTRTNAAP